MSEITAEVVAEHGLNEEEYARILNAMGREPNINELGIFSVMWSEHCSYKSSRRHLGTLPTEAPWVICGPGENAGVIDIGDGQTAIFKMESHNHPSFIEPYQGAATGVGGILRDVFTMGARPVANLNALRFGSPDHPKTRHLLSGVVEGIGGYGNCVGVPTIGGQTDFDPAYDGNILVNAMTVGIADADKVFYSAAAGMGNPVVYVGSKTGRDGIHGATMASAEFDDDSDEKRPTVQVGDPFTEKLLIEACLELMSGDSIVAIQDMGAAGLTSSAVEMASKGDVGLELNLDMVPQREEDMTPYEMMLSESQERMLMVLEPGREDEAMAIFRKWDLDFAVIGKVTDTKHLTLTHKGEVVCDIPIDPLVDDAPNYDRPHEVKPAAMASDSPTIPAPNDLGEALATLMGGHHLSSRRWIWEQYDHQVMGDTVVLPGGDSGVVRVHGTNKALATTTDCSPRYCFADPVEGGKQAVAETWRNISAVGATPLAITNCLNFGNPEKPEIMGQLVGCIQGIAEACLALDYPVVSGNVSLYNETNGQAVLPTPAIGGVGLMQDYTKLVGVAFQGTGQAVYILGETNGHLFQSIYARDLHGITTGPAPKVDLPVEKKHSEFVRAQIDQGSLTACHDVADGGALVALAEMAMAGNVGVDLSHDAGHAFWFGEDQGRYIVTTKDGDSLEQAADAAGVSLTRLGTTGGETLMSVPVSSLSAENEHWMPNYMAAP
jgi:phosphoribosylformylglycinamidine synthase subunit PurL